VRTPTARQTLVAQSEQLALAGAYANAAARYWLSVFPQIRSETRRWQERAEVIPDAWLRALALQAQQRKSANLEGAAAFATFTPKRHRAATVRAQVAFQSIYDYADTLVEQPSVEPRANGRQLHQALLDALCLAPCKGDYYVRQEHSADGGYLEEIVRTCRLALGALPSYRAVAQAAGRLGEKIVSYQSLNYSERQGGQRALAQWASRATAPGSGLRWWETAASAGSSLGVFALIAAASRPGLSSDEALAIEGAYWPWAGALHSLLDSVADESEDAAEGQRSLLDYYASPEEAAKRLRALASEALWHVNDLSHGRQHVVVLAGMAGSYLSQRPLSMRGQVISQAVLAEMGFLSKPTELIFRCKRALSPASKCRAPSWSGASASDPTGGLTT